MVTEIWLPAMSMLSSCCMAFVASDVALYLRQVVLQGSGDKRCKTKSNAPKSTSQSCA